MHFSFGKSCLVALAAVSSVMAQTSGFDVFTQPSTPGSTIPAGQTYTIKWVPSSTPAGTISIVLLQGSSNITLQMGATIASGISGASGSYDWAVPSSGVGYAAYGLKIQSDSDNTIYQYSTYFSISGLAAGSASTTVTVQVSQVTSAANSTTTVSASIVSISNSTTAAPATTAAGIFPNSTTTLLTTQTTTPAGTTVVAASSAPSATKSSAAVSNAAIGGTGLLGALFFYLSLLL